jgi:Skp family chaperone for outer membrane proteins
MALPFTITAAAFAALHALLQKEYKLGDDGGYTLDVTGLEDTGALKRAKDHEKEQHNSTKQKLKDKQKELDDLNLELETLRADHSKGDEKVKNTEALWKDKFTKRETELNKKVEEANAALRNSCVDAVAQKLATDLAGSGAELLMPHLTKRLVGEIVGGKAVTKVLDPTTGEVSALTLDELKNEFLTSPVFATVVIGSKASGAGGTGGRKPGGGAPKKKLSDMTGVEEAKFARENPEQYKAMLAAESGQ